MQVVIENPILNSPFFEPSRHFRFGDEGITNEIAEGRRISSYFIPIAKPKKQGGKQLAFDTEWTQDRIEENKLVNEIRLRVSKWREGGYVGVTPTTNRLLTYWNDPDRVRKLFFCQIEALETAIYIQEVAKRYGDAWIENEKDKAGKITVAIKGVDVYDPTTGQIRSSSTDDIACWFIDTNYNGESFFVRHAYFTGADEPYEKLKRALRAEIDEAAWSSLYSTQSRPFDRPETGKLAVKVVNHYGDEVLKVFAV
jgi:hypothetical protein